MTPKSGLFLLLSSVCAIAAVGSLFELSSGDPQLGNNPTVAILLASIPLCGVWFWLAVQDARANIK